METEEPSHRAKSNTKFIFSSELVFNYLADITFSGHLGVHDATLWNQAVVEFKKWRIKELNCFRIKRKSKLKLNSIFYVNTSLCGLYLTSLRWLFECFASRATEQILRESRAPSLMLSADFLMADPCPRHLNQTTRAKHPGDPFAFFFFHPHFRCIPAFPLLLSGPSPDVAFVWTH